MCASVLLGLFERVPDYVPPIERDIDSTLLNSIDVGVPMRLSRPVVMRTTQRLVMTALQGTANAGSMCVVS